MLKLEKKELSREMVNGELIATYYYLERFLTPRGKISYLEGVRTEKLNHGEVESDKKRYIKN